MTDKEKNRMNKELDDMLKNLSNSDKDYLIRICIINQVKSMVDNYESLNDKDRAFVDGFFTERK